MSERDDREPLLPDTHAHLEDPQFDDDRDDVLLRAASSGVGPILAVGSDITSSVKSVGLAQRYPSVWAAVGIHPHEASADNEERESVRALLDEQRVVAVGEIGLDYVRSAVPRELQLDLFRAQLAWAAERELPVSIHNREADEDVLREVGAAGCRAILHCFSSSEEALREALAIGCYISFAGNVTFPRSTELREVCRHVPLDRLLLESDAPVLAPQPRRGRRNEPAYVAMTAEAVAAERSMPVDALREAVAANAAALFGWTS